MSADDIMTKIPHHDYREPAIECNPEEFEKVVRSRRSVRVFTDEKIPDDVVHKCLDLAILAPTSSNLQSWEFIRVKSEDKKKELIPACMNQSAARTSAELIVCVAKTNTWQDMKKKMLDRFESEAQKHTVPTAARVYYEKIVPLFYNQGPLGIFGCIKKVMFFFMGLKKPTPRNPVSYADMINWATKTTALGCENLMLAFRAYGYDTCPMEGFDSVRVKKILGLGRHDHIAMIIAAGRRAENGVYGPQIRFDRELFIREI